ncbi:MAG TPA: c-type cytochrome [Anaerolineales bacterium]|nr:c-type cytochrome [Anaerolineales bacterium]HMZ42975.1 c-type cytochrome [Anaerolineales bacterium]HNC89017.1 c-type cytochrome [Anaerolineales bacterium]HNF34732.1 c-type cytochrome [Anaerolineales bacterium]HNH78500.1 c-type cytochrome [Anaerolineales bacterium]
MALLFAGLFFDIDTVASQAVATPTIDRLAQPTLPADPTQADQGSQVYWLSCLPCHGDRGQGLTDEFRQTYPVEDQNCWISGCHGKRPYDNGFTLPTAIPAIVGPNTLQKFETAASLRSYIFAAMPYWKPASLTEEETWQVTAYILRESKRLPADMELNASNAASVLVGPPVATSTPQPGPDSVINLDEIQRPVLIVAVLVVALLLALRIFKTTVNKE